MEIFLYNTSSSKRKFFETAIYLILSKVAIISFGAPGYYVFIIISNLKILYKFAHSKNTQLLIKPYLIKFWKLNGILLVSIVFLE